MSKMNEVIILHRSDAMGDFILTTPMMNAFEWAEEHQKMRLQHLYVMTTPLNCQVVENNDEKKLSFIPVLKEYTSSIIACWSWVKEEMKKVIQQAEQSTSGESNSTIRISYLFVGAKKEDLKIILCLRMIYFFRYFFSWWRNSSLKISFRLVGQKHRWPLWIILPNALAQKRSQQNDHEVDLNLKLVLHFFPFVFWPRDLSQFSPKVNVSPRDRELGEKWWRTHSEKGTEAASLRLIVHPGMRGNYAYFPPEKYAFFLFETIQQLDRMTSVKISLTVALTGTAIDCDYNQRFLTEWKKILISNSESKQDLFSMCTVMLKEFDGETLGLSVLKGLMKTANFYIGGSTGTTHLCHAIGTPVLAFMPPVQSQKATRWGPYRAQNFASSIKQSSSNHSHLSNSPSSSSWFWTPGIDCPAKRHCLGPECRYFNCLENLGTQDSFSWQQSVAKLCKTLEDLAIKL